MFDSARCSLPSLDPPDGEDKVSISVEMSSVVYTNSSTFFFEFNSCAADFKLYCMVTLAQSITAAATDLALGIVQRISDMPGQACMRVLMHKHQFLLHVYSSVHETSEVFPSPKKLKENDRFKETK